MRDQRNSNVGHITTDEAFYSVDGSVGRVIVNYDALNIRIGLQTDGMKTILNIIGIIIIGDDDRNLRRNRVDLAKPRIQRFDIALYRAHSKSSFSTTFSCSPIKYFGLSTCLPS